MQNKEMVPVVNELEFNPEWVESKYQYGWTINGLINQNQT